MPSGAVTRQYSPLLSPLPRLLLVSRAMRVPSSFFFRHSPEASSFTSGVEEPPRESEAFSFFQHWSPTLPDGLLPSFLSSSQEV